LGFSLSVVDKMPKRKATTSLDMNGDEGSDEGIGNESDVAIAKRMHPSDVSTTKFGGKETEGLKYFADELGVHFKSLNQNFVASIRQAVEKDPSMCLVPIAQDYVTHCKGLLKKHQKNSSNVPSSSVLPLDNTEEFLKMEKFLREQKSQGTTLPINAAQQLPKFSEPILNGATTASGFSTKKFGGFEFGGSKPAAGPASTMSSGLNTSSGGFQFGSKVASESSPGRIGGFDFGPKPAGVGSSANSPNRGFEFNNSKPEVGGIGTLGSNANSGLGFGQFSPKVPLGVSKSGGSSGFEFNMRKTDTDLSGSAMTSGSSASMSGGFELNTKTGGFGSSSGSSASSGTGFQFTFNKPSVPQTSRVDSPDSTPAAGETDEQKEEESDEPPKNEFKPVVEDDALYSVRLVLLSSVYNISNFSN